MRDRKSLENLIAERLQGFINVSLDAEKKFKEDVDQYMVQALTFRVDTLVEFVTIKRLAEDCFNLANADGYDILSATRDIFYNVKDRILYFQGSGYSDGFNRAMETATHTGHTKFYQRMQFYIYDYEELLEREKGVTDSTQKIVMEMGRKILDAIKKENDTEEVETTKKGKEACRHAANILRGQYNDLVNLAKSYGIEMENE